MSLIASDFGRVHRASIKAKDKWKEILLELGLSPASIKRIGAMYNDNAHFCYLDGLIEWLRNGDRSWRDLVEALSSPTVGHKDIAEEIERKYVRSSQKASGGEKPHEVKEPSATITTTSSGGKKASKAKEPSVFDLVILPIKAIDGIGNALDRFGKGYTNLIRDICRALLVMYICFVGFVVFWMVSLVIGLASLYFYSGSIPDQSTALVELKEPATIFIARFNINESSTIALSHSKSFPTDFYGQDCALVGTEIVQVSKSGSLDLAISNGIDERYVAFNTSLLYTIQAPQNVNLEKYRMSLVVFENLEDYQTFLNSGLWSTSFKEFPVSIRSSDAKVSIAFIGMSYYYIGLHTQAPSDLNGQQLSYEISGRIEQYDLNSFKPITCSQSNTDTCTITLSDLELQSNSEVCIVGHVSGRSSGEKVQSVIVNAHADNAAKRTTMFYFFLPFLTATVIGCLAVLVFFGFVAFGD